MEKICIISPSFPNMNCGLADYAANLANFMEQKDVNVSVVTSDNAKTRAYAASGYNSAIKIYPLIRNWDFSALRLVKRAVSGIRPDAVNIMYHWNVYKDGIIKGAMIIFMPLFLKVGNPHRRVIISFVHDLVGPYLFPKAGPLRRLALLFMLVSADAFIVHTKEQEERLAAVCRFLKKKVYRIPCGSGIFYEAKAGDPGYTKADSVDDEVAISFFGYIYPSKGLEYLIEAAALLVGKGYRMKLSIIGGEELDYNINSLGSYQSRIRELISGLKIEDAVEWMGFCSSQEASRVLLKSDICVLPFTSGVSAKGSSFGVALSHGLPLVTTKGEDTPDRLIDHENVLFVPACNSVATAAAIEELINDKELRSKLAFNARRIYEEEYSWPVIATRVMRACCEGAVP